MKARGTVVTKHNSGKCGAIAKGCEHSGKAMFLMLGVFAEFERSVRAMAYSGPSVKVSDLAARQSRTRLLGASGRLWRLERVD